MALYRTLDSKMNDAEKAELGNQLSDVQLKISKLMGLKASIPKEIALLQEQAEEIATQYKTGLTKKEVEVRWKLDPENWKKTLIRIDTGENLETTDMTWFDFPDNEETVFEMLYKYHEKEDGKYIEFSPAEGMETLKHRFPENRAKIICQDLDNEFFMKGAGTILIEGKDFLIARKTISKSLKKEIPEPENQVQINEESKTAEQLNEQVEDEEHIEVND